MMMTSVIIVTMIYWVSAMGEFLTTYDFYPSPESDMIRAIISLLQMRTVIPRAMKEVSQAEKWQGRAQIWTQAWGSLYLCALPCVVHSSVAVGFQEFHPPLWISLWWVTQQNWTNKYNTSSKRNTTESYSNTFEHDTLRRATGTTKLFLYFRTKNWL